MKKMLVALVLVSCGKAGGGSGGDSAPVAQSPAAGSTSMLVADKASLPACDTSRGGQLAYVKAESKFYGCDGSAWAEVAIKGEKGDKGDAGTNGTDNRVTAYIYCSTALTVNTGADFSAYRVYYLASVLSSGDVHISTTIGNTDTGFGNARIYAKTQAGAATGHITVNDDSYGAANDGYWEIDLNRESLAGTIKYTDSNLTGGYRTWAIVFSECTKTNY